MPRTGLSGSVWRRRTRPGPGSPAAAALGRTLSDSAFGRVVPVSGVDADRCGHTIGRVGEGAADMNVETVRRGAAWVFRRHGRDSGAAAARWRSSGGRAGSPGAAGGGARTTLGVVGGEPVTASVLRGVCLPIAVAALSVPAPWTGSARWASRLTVTGAGAGVTCAEWAAAGGSDLELERWVFGSASAGAVGVRLRRAPPVGGDAGATHAWLADYCRGRPGNALSVALVRMVFADPR